MKAETKQKAPSSPFEVSDASIVDYLDQAQNQGTDAFLDALSVVARAKGLEKIANDAGLNRISLYRSLKAGSKPRYETINSVLNSMGLSIQVKVKS